MFSPKYVLALNQTFALLNEYAPRIIEALKQYKGKILITGGTRSYKLGQLINSFNLPNTPETFVSVWFSSNQIFIYSSKKEDGKCLYDEYFHFAEVLDDNFIRIKEFIPYRTDYTVKKLNHVEKEYKKAKDIVNFYDKHYPWLNTLLEKSK